MPSSTGEAPRPRAALREVGVFILFVVAGVLATWPLARHAATWAPGWGDPLEITWIFGWGAHSLADNPFGLIDGSIFNANIFHPEPLTLAYTESFLGLSVVAAPVIWLTSNPLLAFNLVTIGLYVSGGYATYLLMRHLTPYWPAGIVAGLAFTFTPYRMSQIGHTHVVAIHLMPIVLLMLLKLRHNPSRRFVVATGLVFGLQIWSSFTGTAMTLVVVGAWGTWELACRKKAALPSLGRACIALTLGLLLAIPVIKPFLDLREIHPDFKHPDIVVVQFSATPKSYLYPPEGNVLFRSPYKALARRYEDAEGYWEKSLFPGFVLSGGFALAVGATALTILTRRRHRRRAADNDPDNSHDPGEPATKATCDHLGYMLLFLLIASLGFVISLGPRMGATPDGMHLPFAFIAELGFSSLARVPARFGSLVPFGMAVVLGLAISATSPPWRRRLVGGSLALLSMELLLPTLHPLPAPAITAAHRSIDNTRGAVLGLPTVELRPDGSLYEDTVSREEVHLYLSMGHFRPIINGYGSFHPESFWEVVEAVQDFPSREGMRVLRDRGVDTIVVQTDLVRGTHWDDVVERLDNWPGALPAARDRGVRVYDISDAADAVDAPPTPERPATREGHEVTTSSRSSS